MIGPFSLWTLLTLSASAQSAGDAVITEISIAPNADVSEWFELTNRSGHTLDLSGCTLYEGSGAEGDWANWGHQYTIANLTLANNQRGVLMNNDGADDCVAYTSTALTTCDVPPDVVYSALSFNNTGTERLALVCNGTLIDAISYAWSTFSADCSLANNKNCSVALRETNLTATANDDWSADAWCVPEGSEYIDEAGTTARGTPGETNVCPQILGSCGAGQAVFTELMIDPPDGYKEFIELYGAGGSECNLSGCQLMEGPNPDPFAVEDWDVITLTGQANNLPLMSGDHFLLARSSEWVAGTMVAGEFVGQIPADYTYSGISLPNTEESWVHLVCDGSRVDSAPVDWESLVALCPGGNCAANLNPSGYTAAANDALSGWCVPPPGNTFTNPAGEEIVATPGARSVCLSLNWPDPGEVIFTEALISPQGDVPEYLELKNITSAERDLSYCALRRYRLGDDGEENPDSVKLTLLGADGVDVSVIAGGIQLLSYKDCVFPDENGDCTLSALYDTIQLSATEDEHLQLLCDGVLIDEVSLYHDGEGIRPGHAMMLDPGAETTEGNDDTSAWCEAAFSQRVEGLCDVENGDCNYGTPGVQNICLTDKPTPPDPVMRCSSSGGTGAWWSAALAMLAMAGRRRRGVR
ncbi:MAG: lamin tail domain-containing protein [Deltaproteobacteria bacterium]|nr:lamin tail domain-containing protein [Deltaproteobacteria bacterium]